MSILLILLLIVNAYFFFCLIYAEIQMKNQDEEFQKNLKVGDETRLGIVERIDEDTVFISPPYRILNVNKKSLRPLRYKFSKLISFLFPKK